MVEREKPLEGREQGIDSEERKVESPIWKRLWTSLNECHGKEEWNWGTQHLEYLFDFWFKDGIRKGVW